MFTFLNISKCSYGAGGFGNGNQQAIHTLRFHFFYQKLSPVSVIVRLGKQYRIIPFISDILNSADGLRKK